LLFQEAMIVIQAKSATDKISSMRCTFLFLYLVLFSNTLKAVDIIVRLEEKNPAVHDKLSEADRAGYLQEIENYNTLIKAIVEKKWSKDDNLLYVEASKINQLKIRNADETFVLSYSVMDDYYQLLSSYKSFKKYLTRAEKKEMLEAKLRPYRCSQLRLRQIKTQDALNYFATADMPGVTPSEGEMAYGIAALQSHYQSKKAGKSQKELMKEAIQLADLLKTETLLIAEKNAMPGDIANFSSVYPYSLKVVSDDEVYRSFLNENSKDIAVVVAIPVKDGTYRFEATDVKTAKVLASASKPPPDEDDEEDNSARMGIAQLKQFLHFISN
jgi:hypothetical protein